MESSCKSSNSKNHCTVWFKGKAKRTTKFLLAKGGDNGMVTASGTSGQAYHLILYMHSCNAALLSLQHTVEAQYLHSSLPLHLLIVFCCSMLWNWLGGPRGHVDSLCNLRSCNFVCLETSQFHISSTVACTFSDALDHRWKTSQISYASSVKLFSCFVSSLHNMPQSCNIAVIPLIPMYHTVAILHSIRAHTCWEAWSFSQHTSWAPCKLMTTCWKHLRDFLKSSWNKYLDCVHVTLVFVNNFCV